MCCPLTCRLRFVLVLVLTIVGGNMFSSLLEEECFFYAGASSGVYGVIGMQFGDALYNWHRTEAPLARILITPVRRVSRLCVFMQVNVIRKSCRYAAMCRASF